MKKVNISICSSPNCYIESARLFKQLDTLMSARLKVETDCTGSKCPGYCKLAGKKKAPCAVVGSHTIFNATPSKVLAAVTTA
jgi:NADH:ubiquinone oxidoreductase subunit E